MSTKLPNGWFNISPERYADLGAMLYLSSLTKTHNQRSLTQAIYAFETPWRLKQYHIFRENGFPRGFATFAGLSPQAEHKYAVKGEALTDKDFASGPSFWIVDVVAPFGQIRQIVNILKREIPHKRVRTNRMDSDLSQQRIVEWTKDDTGKIHMRLFKKPDFERLLSEEV
ncbi:toxin-activating lysine-acyltransferase [Falsihalocynthiibacter sp. SS001]|uniref:toxin-activating lysine-acyltransferase n=1 Tax=Falsihalocynthiibacter sp. SS001 TaxID=3349698 RepID=UPI0036D34503